MHLKLKPQTDNIRTLYENHTNYHEGDSGLDLFVTERMVVPGKALSFKVDLGISCEAFMDKTKQMNVSYYLYPRSSMGAKSPLRLSNSVGIIDSGYRGNIIGIVDNLSDEDYVIEVNTRLFQLCSPVLAPISFEVVNSLSETSRGNGGLGSTGA
jgi:dUTP pyrophosphatase